MKTRFLTKPTMVILSCLVAFTVLLVLRRDQTKAVADEKANVVPGKISKSDFSPYVDRDDNISLPKNYKQAWSQLGALER